MKGRIYRAANGAAEYRSHPDHCIVRCRDLEARDPCRLGPSRCGRAGPANNHYGRRRTTVLPLNAKPGRDRHVQQSQCQCASHRRGGPRRRRGRPQAAVLRLASGSSSKAQAHWAMRKPPTWLAGRNLPSWRANAAAAPPRPALLASSQSPPAAAA